MAVLGDVAVLGRLVDDDRHRADLGVLLLDEVLARLAPHGAAEEELHAAVEGVGRQGVLGAEQLHAQPQARPHETPRRGRLADERGAVLGLVLDGHAGEVLGGARPIVDFGPHGLPQPGGVLGPGPLQGGDAARHPPRPDRRSQRAGGGQQVPHYLDRVAGHVVQHPAALQVAAPEPRPVGAAVLLGGAGQVRPAGEGGAAMPQQLAPPGDGRREDLVLQVAVGEAGLGRERTHPLRLGDGAGKGLLAGHPTQRRSRTHGGHHRFQVLDARVVRPAQPDRIDGRVGGHRLDRGERPGVAHVELTGQRCRLFGVLAAGAPAPAHVGVPHPDHRPDVEAGDEPAADEPDAEPSAGRGGAGHAAPSRSRGAAAPRAETAVLPAGPVMPGPLPAGQHSPPRPHVPRRRRSCCVPSILDG